MIFFRPVCRAKTYRGFSNWVAVLMAHECLVVLCNKRSHERKLILKYRPLSKARSKDRWTSFNLNAIEFISNFVKYGCNAIISKGCLRLVLSSSLSRRYVQTLCWRTDCTCEFQSWLRSHRKSAHLQCSRYLSSQIFRTIKPNDFKNSTSQKVSSSMLLSFLWIFLIVVSALKIVSFVGFTCSFNTSISYERLRTCSLTV